MDDGTEKIVFDEFCYADLKKKFNDIKQIANDQNYEGNKELSIHKLLQCCIQMLNTGKNTLECMEKASCTSSIIMTNLISHEKGVIESFKHCSDSSLIYGDLIVTVVPLLTDLFKTTTDIQTLFFNIFEKVEFDFMQEIDLQLLLNGLQQIWYSARATYNTSNKIMATNWKMYITISQKYSTEIKGNIINDEPIDFLCSEIKNIIVSLKDNDEPSLKLMTYMMSVLVKLCSYGCILKSHNILLEFILFLNSYWLSDTQNVITVKDRLSQYADQLVLISDETFIKIFQLNCQDIINTNCSNRKISMLYIAILMLKRFIKTPCHQQQAYEIICIVFQFIRYSGSVMFCYNIDIYEHLLLNLVSVILVSDYSLFENIEKILIKSILSTEYWPAMFSSDLWIIVMRNLPPDMCNLQFSKLARIMEALIDLPCFAHCPQHIYLEILLRRHFTLITDKKQLVNTCLQFKTQSLKSAIGILHVPTLSKYDRLSELIKIITILPEQKNYEHLNRDILHLWNCISDEYPSNFICALVEVSIGSESLLKTIIPKSTKLLNIRAYDDTTEMKRCRLRLIRSILLHMSSFQEKLIMDIFLEYLFDPHPMVQQWTVETIVYFSSVAVNQNFMSMLFKQSKIRTIITDYLEMKINHTYNHNDCIQYYEQLSLCGKFQHKCSFKGKLDKVLDKLKTDVDCLNDILNKTQVSSDELERLKKYSSLLNNICKIKELEIKKCSKYSIE